MSYCRFGVSPVNYHDPDPGCIINSYRLVQMLILLHKQVVLNVVRGLNCHSLWVELKYVSVMADHHKWEWWIAISPQTDYSGWGTCDLALFLSHLSSVERQSKTELKDKFGTTLDRLNIGTEARSVFKSSSSSTLFSEFTSDSTKFAMRAAMMEHWTIDTMFVLLPKIV